ncbi:MAG: hypothetical protein QNK37_37320 [Acidobacteriota bacterium]|nr:hypothetical protein [Acidobacteriota bacterium]
MLLKNLFFLFCLLLSNTFLYAGEVCGATTIIGDEEGFTVHFGPGEGGSILVLTYDDPEGGLLWKRVFRATGKLHAGAAVLDGATIFITGSFSGQALFETTRLQSGHGFDAFVAAYTAYGECLWIGQYGGAANTLGLALVWSHRGLNLVGEMDGAIFLALPFPNGKIPLDLDLSEEYNEPQYVVETEGTTDPSDETTGESSGGPPVQTGLC